ncbi:MAG TPA: hypothetical protein PKA06_04960 [Gemmatales bacterium]|nr:hypothetical protein [Gemmatales bacterium]
MLVLGCGTADIFEHLSDDPPVTVSGKVYYRGYALNGGYISFISELSNESAVVVEVMSDGTFQLNSGLKPGKYRIAVTNHRSAHWGLPSRYANPQISGLFCQVHVHQPLRLRIELD